MARLKAIKTLHEFVDILDTSFVGQKGPRLYRYAENQACFGMSFLEANRLLLRKANKVQPDVIWIDKGFWIYSLTLRMLKQRGSFLVQHNTDDLFAKHGRWAYRLLRANWRLYDVNFTTNSWNLVEMNRRGGSQVELTSLGYDHERFCPRALSDQGQARWSHAVTFVGHWEPATENYVLALVKADLPVSIYGWNWHKASHLRELSGVVHARFLGGEDYVNCLRGTKIGLGFLSKINRNQTAGRSFEIPACGTFLLAERTAEHQRLYEEGTEAEFFSDPDELVRKVRLY
ncbi:MAG: hypothetical protein E8D45_08360, partial [Nitrospira sp.]